jgi:UDP-N-acetylmuramate--alanine ligase
VTDIYSAGEAPIPGVQSGLLVENIRRHGIPNARHVAKPMEGIEAWLGESAPGDVIFTLGAGDLPNVYKQLF